MKAYIYCRTSSKDSKTTQNQIDDCSEYCQEHGIEIVNVYKHVQSSRNMKNYDYVEKIIEEMNSGDILIVHSICRFSRNMLGGLKLLELMEKKNIKIYAVDDHIGYDDIYDKRKFRDIMNESELETDRLSHRIKHGKVAAKKRLQIVKETKSKSNKLIDNVINNIVGYKK